MWLQKFQDLHLKNFLHLMQFLGTSMKSVGEAMAIGRNFKESLQKALVSLEIGFSGLDRIFHLIKKI